MSKIQPPIATPHSQFMTGQATILPVLLGVIPFAMISGVAAASMGFSMAMTMGMSIIVFAGVAQLVALQIIGLGAPPLLVICSIVMVNLRFTMYSASISPHLKGVPKIWKIFLAYLMTDQAYALSMNKFNQEPDLSHKPWFFFGTEMLLWVAWQISTFIGFSLGTTVPESWSLSFIIPLMFLVLMINSIKTMPSAIAALAGGAAAVVTVGLPFHLGMFVAALMGIVAGMVAEGRRR